VAVVRSNVSEERIASIIRPVVLGSVLQLLVTANVLPSSLIVFTLMMEVICPPKRLLLQQLHGVTSQKTLFLIVTAV
jgi:hypothetical protein